MSGSSASTAPCINREGDVDPTFADCSVTSPRCRSTSRSFAEDRAGYLAGMVAATASEGGIIGAVDGVSLCGVCAKYMQGYVLGAKSIGPDITVKTAWVSDSDFVLGFANQAAGKTFGDQFIQQNEGLDVLFQVAGLTGNGLVDAACAAGIRRCRRRRRPARVLSGLVGLHRTSAEELARSVSESVEQMADGSAKGSLTFYNAQPRHRLRAVLRG